VGGPALLGELAVRPCGILLTVMTTMGDISFEKRGHFFLGFQDALDWLKTSHASAVAADFADRSMEIDGARCKEGNCQKICLDFCRRAVTLILQAARK
jgi:hypothetical protein